MIKLRHLIKEVQKFDFDHFKSQIQKQVDYILDNKISEAASKKQLQNIFYDIIRNNTGGSLNTHKKLGFLDSQVKEWNQYFSSNAWNKNGPWSQRDFNSTFTRKSGKDKTYNYYITLDKTKDNIMKFWNFLPRLDRELKTLSDSQKSPISYKIHNHLDYIIVDNDSLKIYYYDNTLKSQIENLVKMWATNNKINLSPRSHSHGADVRYNPTDSKNSYGEILSKHIAEQYYNVIKTYSKTYTSEQYFEWIKKSFEKLITNVKVD